MERNQQTTRRRLRQRAADARSDLMKQETNRRESTRTLEQLEKDARQGGFRPFWKP